MATSSHRNSDNSSDHKTPPQPRPRPLTNTNSDEQCLTDPQNSLSRALYVLSLKTGFYAIEPMDRRFSLVIVCFLMMVSTMMFYVFVQGVRDGFQQATVAMT